MSAKSTIRSIERKETTDKKKSEDKIGKTKSDFVGAKKIIRRSFF